MILALSVVDRSSFRCFLGEKVCCSDSVMNNFGTGFSVVLFPSTKWFEHTVMYGPGLKFLRPFDTLFLQSSDKASPFGHRCQINSDTCERLTTIDRYCNDRYCNDRYWSLLPLIVIATTNSTMRLFPHHAKHFTKRMQARAENYSKLPSPNMHKWLIVH